MNFPLVGTGYTTRAAYRDLEFVCVTFPSPPLCPSTNANCTPLLLYQMLFVGRLRYALVSFRRPHSFLVSMCGPVMRSPSPILPFSFSYMYVSMLSQFPKGSPFSGEYMLSNWTIFGPLSFALSALSHALFAYSPRLVVACAVVPSWICPELTITRVVILDVPSSLPYHASWRREADVISTAPGRVVEKYDPSAIACASSAC